MKERTKLVSIDETKVRYQFDHLCRLVLHGEATNCYRNMDCRRKHEITFSELTEDELSRFYTVDDYGLDTYRFQVLGYVVEVKNNLIAQALQLLTKRKREIILLSYFLDMSGVEISRMLNLSCSTVHEHRVRALEILKEVLMERDIYGE